jgi:hypothetical protein
MGAVCCTERAPNPQYLQYENTTNRDFQHLNDVERTIYNMTSAPTTDNSFNDMDFSRVMSEESQRRAEDESDTSSLHNSPLFVDRGNKIFDANRLSRGRANRRSNTMPPTIKQEKSAKPTVVTSLDDLLRASRDGPPTIKYSGSSKRTVAKEDTIETITETPVRNLDKLLTAARSSTFTKPLSISAYATPIQVQDQKGGSTPIPGDITHSAGKSEVYNEDIRRTQRDVSWCRRSHTDNDGSNTSDWYLTTSSSEKEIDSARESSKDIGCAKTAKWQ